MSFWFPEYYRARATGLFLLAQPVALTLGAPISGLILEMDGTLGLEGWRWLFLLEGLPPILLGIVAYVWLTDKPAAAHWLTAAEKTTLEQAVDRQDRVRSSGSSPWRELRSRTLLLLCLAYLGIPVSIGTFAVWSPLILRDVLSGSQSMSAIGWVAAIPSAFACLFLLWWSRRSDRRRERTWHLIGAVLLAAAGWVALALFRQPPLQIAGLCLGAMGSIASQGIFYPFATARLSRVARPVGIATISAVSILFSSISPLIIGTFRDLTQSFAAGLFFSAAMLVVTALMVLAVVRIRPDPEAVETPGRPRSAEPSPSVRA